MTEQPVDDDKNKDGAEAAAAQFFCAIAGNKGPDKFIHIVSIVFF